METSRLDGNAAAGILQELFVAEMTTAIGTCGGCGVAGEVATAHLYHSAGLTFRCPHCDTVLMTIVETDSRTWIDLRGLRTLEVRH
jgi:Family of unknown function (DUF6510)